MIFYGHGGDIYDPALGEKVLDFSANINPLGLPKGAKKALLEGVQAFERYPDPYCRQLTAVLAKHLGVEQDFILFGNGAADLLYRLAQLLRPAAALLLAPGFCDYARSLESVGCKIKYHYLSEAKDLRLERDILPKINTGTKIVYLCNPNNPTGQLVDRTLVTEILGRCEAKGAYLLLDECFMDLVDPKEAYSLKDELAAHPRLLILKAFTKTYAMAGLRLGYLLCSDAALMDRLRQQAQAWSVSGPAQAAGAAALEEQGYLEKTHALLAGERSYMRSRLARMGLKVYGSAANYIFFRLPVPFDLKAGLLKRGILVRSCADYPGLDERYYRVAVKKRKDGQRLLKAIEDCLQDAIAAIVDRRTGG